jgi:hypothetical protein
VGAIRELVTDENDSNEILTHRGPSILRRHGGGTTTRRCISDVGEPEGDVRDTDVGLEGDFLGRILLWGEQDQGHPLSERHKPVV